MVGRILMKKHLFFPQERALRRADPAADVSYGRFGVKTPGLCAINTKKAIIIGGFSLQFVHYYDILKEQ